MESATAASVQMSAQSLIMLPADTAFLFKRARHNPHMLTIAGGPFCYTAESSRIVKAHGSSSRLLQLPAEALVNILQQLDQRSLANLAVSCTALRHTLPGNLSTAVVSCTRPDTAAVDSFMLWFDQHSSSHTRLERCIIECYGSWRLTAPPRKPRLRDLPCPQLCELRLEGLTVELNWPRVLRVCTGLTSLGLKNCLVFNMPAASYAIEALPALRQLSLEDNWDKSGGLTLPADQLPTALTHLRLAGDGQTFSQQLSQLSGLVNLEHLGLSHSRCQGVPGGLPSQLVKLTCLESHHMLHNKDGLDEVAAVAQLGHFSALTALQKLNIKFDGMSMDVPVSRFSGIAHLSQLTSLELTGEKLCFDAHCTHMWPRLTALHKLTLTGVKVHPAAIRNLTQLHALSLDGVRLSWDGDASDEATLVVTWPRIASYVPVDVMSAVSRLTQLTQLHMRLEAGKLDILDGPRPLAPATAFTVLTASTHLCSLEVDFTELSTPPDIKLFRPTVVYPHLRQIHLNSIAPSPQQLQRLSSCCPGLDSLAIVLSQACQPATCQALLQLSALTSLVLLVPGTSADAATGLTRVAAQLTGLKSLTISRCRPGFRLVDLSAVQLLRLTALTALESLEVTAAHPRWKLVNKASHRNAPDVWIQLLWCLLADTSCQALLQRSVAGTARPAERLLMQLAATLR